MTRDFDLGLTVGNTFQLWDRVEDTLDIVSARLQGEDKSWRSFRQMLAGQRYVQRQLLPALLELAAPEADQLHGNLFRKALR